MALHTGPKLILAAMNHSVYTATNNVPRHMAQVTSLLSVAELTSLLMVTVVPSVELYNLHIFATGVFLVCSGLHMTLSCYLVRSDINISDTFIR